MRGVLRVARPSADPDRLTPFYVDGLGLQVLARFADHEGFDGLILGEPGAPWHLEFTRHVGSDPPDRPDPDDLIVVYLPDEAARPAVLERLRAAGHAPVAAFNPYWDTHGVTFEDPEGRRVVVCSLDWRL